MHCTRRAICVERSGSRFVATAAKPAPPRPVSKWDLPDIAAPYSSAARDHDDPPHASTSSASGKWSQSPPTQTGPYSSSTRATPLWSRPANKSAPDPASTYLSKWNRPGTSVQGAIPERAPINRSRFDRDDRPQTRVPGSQTRAPNVSGSFGLRPPGPAPSSNPRTQTSRGPWPSTRNTLDFAFDSPPKKKVEMQEGDPEGVSQHSKQQQDEAVYRISVDAEEYADSERSAKSSRYGRTKGLFKERGSIANRMSEDVAIPKYSRVKADPRKMKEVKPQRRKYVQATRDVYIPSAVSVGNLAKLLNVRLDTLQRKMVRAGMNDEASYDHILTAEWASLIAMEFGINPVVDDEAAFDIYPPAPAADSSTLPARPPVVTIMGHVDHGKTTLLDTLRSASVAKGEAGGITQHIGAFSVPVPGPDDDPKSERFITFLDTPGHAAFSAMRARGAGVTDIIVLVVAADDGIMPQTREVLELVKKEPDVGLVVAINKIDKAGADISKVEKALFAEGVQFESFGGDIPSVHVSGLTGQGLPQLVETISLIAELQDLRAERTGMVQGYVIESKIQKGLGAVATVLVSRGELTPGTHLIAGTAPGKVRLLTSPSGGPVKSVSPGTAAVVSGWKELPKAGDEVLSGSESEIKRAVANRLRKIEIETSLQDVEAINLVRREERERKEAEEEKDREETEKTVEKKDEKKELRIIIKGDVSGSVEAVSGALVGIGNHLAGVKIVAAGVGDVSESDVMRAKAAEGMVVAFSVKIPRPIEAMAASQGVQFLKSSVIYHLMDQVKERVIGLLPIKVETKVTGEANVLQLFDIRLKRKQTMKVAGCRVIYGVVDKDKKARVVRKGKTVHEGKLETLRQIKKDIMQAGKGMECGMAFEGWDDLRDGDLIQVYEEIEKAGSL